MTEGPIDYMEHRGAWMQAKDALYENHARLFCRPTATSSRGYGPPVMTRACLPDCREQANPNPPAHLGEKWRSSSRGKKIPLELLP